ncbi:hypothetical protein MIR68_010418 [Amoeboaphelidium protococcarum]|nr:hypothetical protein MIR68_010418 [Amoeboaphelidium protococcarum]
MKLIYIAITLSALVYDPVDANLWLGRRKQPQIQQTQDKQYRSIGGQNDGPVEGGMLTRNALKWYGLPTVQNGGVFIQSQQAAVVMCWTEAPDAKMSEMKVQFNTNHGIRGGKVEAGEVKVSPLTEQKLKQIQDAYVQNYEGFSKALIPDQVRKLLADSRNGVTVNDQDAQTGDDQNGEQAGEVRGRSGSNRGDFDQIESRSSSRSPIPRSHHGEQNMGSYEEQVQGLPGGDQEIETEGLSMFTIGSGSSMREQPERGIRRVGAGSQLGAYQDQAFDQDSQTQGENFNQESNFMGLNPESQYSQPGAEYTDYQGFFKRGTDGKDGGMLFNVPKNYMAKTKSGEPICYAVEFTVPGDIKPSHQAQLIVYRSRALKNKNLHSPQFNIVAKPQFPENLIIGRSSHQGEGSGSQTRSSQSDGPKSDKQQNSQAKDGIASFWTRLFGGEKKQ